MKQITLIMICLSLAFFTKAQEIKKEYWNDGSLHSWAYYVNGKKHGREVTYYAGGYSSNYKKKSELCYVKGVLEGPTIDYFKSGNVASITYFKNGVRNGHEIYFYDYTRKIMHFGRYKDGKEVGTWTYYDKKGKIKEIKKY